MEGFDGLKGVDARKAIPIGEAKRRERTEERFAVPKGHVLVFYFAGQNMAIIPDVKMGYANGVFACEVAYCAESVGDLLSDFHAVRKYGNFTAVGLAFISFTVPEPKWWSKRNKAK